MNDNDSEKSCKVCSYQRYTYDEFEDEWTLSEPEAKLPEAKYNIFYYNCFADFPQEKLAQITETVTSICQVVFRYQGKLIGGVVRDYFIPKLQHEQTFKSTYVQLLMSFISIRDLCNMIIDYFKPLFLPSLEQNPKDIDVWITNKEQELNILHEFHRIGFRVKQREYMEPHEKINRRYPFPLNQYHVIIGDIVIWVDFIQSQDCPTDDFSVNLLSYDGVRFKCEEYKEYPYLALHGVDAPLPKFTAEDIIQQIQNKTTYILPKYLLSPVEFAAERIQKIHKHKGYEFLNASSARDEIYENSHLCKRKKRQRTDDLGSSS